jgi:hypothetical protein
VAYPSVRTSFGYLGIKASERDRQANRAKRAELRGDLERLAAEGCSRREMSERLSLPRSMVEKACREMGIVVYTEPAHGTLTRYRNWACRCVDCITANTDYCNKHSQNRKAEDAPHGTVSGYRNWGCRCAPCREAGIADQNERTAKTPQHETNLHREWTKEEHLLALDFSLSAREVADLLGRSIASVNQRRSGKYFKLVKVSETQENTRRFKEKVLTGMN